MMRQFHSVRPTDEQIAFIRATLCRYRFLKGNCFWNAQKAVISANNHRLEYAEGTLSAYSSRPIHHAWVVLDGEVVVELSQRCMPWEKSPRSPLRGRYVGEFPAQWQYIGVRFATIEVARSVMTGSDSRPMMSELKAAKI